jgi:hypothetical protein
MGSMSDPRPSRDAAGRFSPTFGSTPLFRPASAFLPRGEALSVYLGGDALDLLRGWSSGRRRSARLAAILGRYGAIASAPPELTPAELAIVRRLLPPLSGMDALSTVWARIADLARDGRLRPAAEAEALARRLRGLTLGEALGLLEAVDRASLTDHTSRGDRP